MTVIKLQSLVLSGFSVPQGGKVENMRREVSYSAVVRTPEIPISMRQPSRGVTREFPPAPRSSHADLLCLADATAKGTGRSRSRAGVLDGGVLRLGLAWCKPAGGTNAAI